MDSALIVVTKPIQSNHAGKEQWRTFLGALSKTEQPSGTVEALGENVWLIPLKSGLPALSALLESAKSCGFAYKVQFIDGTVEWMKYAPPKHNE